MRLLLLLLRRLRALKSIFSFLVTFPFLFAFTAAVSRSPWHCYTTLSHAHTHLSLFFFFFLLVCFFFFFFCVDGAGTKKETHLIIRVTEPPRRLPAKVLASFHVQRFFFFVSVSASLPFCHILLSFDQFLRVFFFLAYRSVHFRPDSCVHLCKRALSRTLRTLIFCLLFLLVYCSASPSGEIDSDFFVSLSFFFPPYYLACVRCSCGVQQQQQQQKKKI